jgi:hypothetical protein
VYGGYNCILDHLADICRPKLFEVLEANSSHPGKGHEPTTVVLIGIGCILIVLVFSRIFKAENP